MPNVTTTQRDNQRLAAELRELRGDISLASIAPEFGIPLRTLQGIEQGRGFKYPHLLRLAMKQIGSARNGD